MFIHGLFHLRANKYKWFVDGNATVTIPEFSELSAAISRVLNIINRLRYPPVAKFK